MCDYIHPSRTQHRRQGMRCAFTLVELLVVIGIIALLISILLPALNRAREAANQVQCASNMRQIGMGLSAYLSDHNASYPQQTGDQTYWFPLEDRTWWGAIGPYIGWSKYNTVIDVAAGTVGHCPSHESQFGQFSYMGNMKLITNYSNTGERPRKVTNVVDHTNAVVVFESHDLDNRWPFTFNGLVRGKRGVFWPSIVANPTHGKQINYLFCDGHVAGYDTKDLYPDPSGWEFNPMGN